MSSLRNPSLLPHYAATLKLGVPIAIGQLGVIILGFADTMMVGRYSTEALASASFVNNLFTLITFFFMGYSYGLTAHHRHQSALRQALSARDHLRVGGLQRIAAVGGRMTENPAPVGRVLHSGGESKQSF